jgi:hypothetical protein
MRLPQRGEMSDAEVLEEDVQRRACDYRPLRPCNRALVLPDIDSHGIQHGCHVGKQETAPGRLGIVAMLHGQHRATIVCCTGLFTLGIAARMIIGCRNGVVGAGAVHQAQMHRGRDVAVQKQRSHQRDPTWFLPKSHAMLFVALVLDWVQAYRIAP